MGEVIQFPKKKIKVDKGIVKSSVSPGLDERYKKVQESLDKINALFTELDRMRKRDGYDTNS